MYFNKPNMRKTLTTLAVAVTGMVSTAFAQQDPQFTQFMHVKQAYNPAYAGTSDAICFGAMYRQQWVNFNGAPKTGLFTFDMPVAALHGGVGFYFANDKLGNDNTNMARVAYAFHIPLGAQGTGKLSFGLDGGIYQKRIAGNWVPPETLNDPAIPNNPVQGGNGSPQFGTGSPALNKLSPDLGFGIYYTIPNKMYVGVSATHLGAQDLKGAVSNATPPNNYKLQFDVARHYYLIAGYTFLLDQGGYHKLTPNIKVKSDGSSTQMDINLTYMYNNQIWIGASYRLQDAVAPMIGYMAPFGLKVGYSYDVTTSKLNGYSAGTHEIMLGYCFKPKNVPKISSHTNVRFLED
jgi:type IX secretion system PorP/SprF family membrane protein